ncbi:MAG: DUF4397 domain-containing protein [Phycisphaerales bacterium]|nr:DUF4397 domain-containing protein [Phycisphaerales bacterium]
MHPLMVTSGVVIASIATMASAADVRVAHLSPDAPAVDVLVNGAPAFTNVAFGDVTGYAELPEGTYDIKVVAAGTTGPAVIDAMIPLPESGDFTIAAVDSLKNIGAVIYADVNVRTPGSTGVRFVHASPGTPAVDIAVANGGPVLFADVAFGESGGYVTVPSGEYDLEARVAGTEIVALSLPGVALTGGTSITVWAKGFLNGEPALGVAVSLDLAPTANIRVIHASPDAPAVDVKVNGARAIEQLPFNEGTPYTSLPADTYNIQVVPAGLDDPVVIDATLPLDAFDYSVIAINTLANIQPLVLVDNNELWADARIRFVHASPDAPAVDIALANGGPVLFSNVSFGENGGYISVPGGIYDLEARVAGTDTVALDVPGLNVTGFRSFTVVATGLLTGEPALGVLPLLDDERCATDIVGDGQTGVNDILTLLSKWDTSDPWADVDDSGFVDVDDAMLVIMNYGTCGS